MISTYIKELLKLHNRVIVPDLGAFLKKSENPDQIYFNEFLRFNDGLLVDYLAEKGNIDKIEAAKQLKSFVAEVNRDLKEKRFVDLKEIGTLSLDSNDKIQLKVELLKAYIPEESVPDMKNSIKKPIQNSPEIEAEPENKPREITEKPVSEKQTEKAKAIKNKKENINEVIKETPIEKQVDKTEEDAEFVTNYNTGNYFEENERSGSRPFLWLGIAIFLILLVIAWIYVINPRLNKSASDQNNVLIGDTSQFESSNKKIEDTVPVEDLSNIKVDKKAEFVQTAKDGNYYIVAGCFAMEVNADNMVKSLTEKGFMASKFTKIDELYYVSAGSFSNKDEAQRELQKLQSQGYPESWLMKH